MSILEPPPLHHLDTAEDLLGALARLDDFHHFRSLVCVLSRNRAAIGAFRMDLPRREAEAAATVHIVGLVAATEADSVALVSYSATATPEPRPRFIAGLASALNAAGYGLYGPIWVGRQDWGFYDGPVGSAALPPGGYADTRPPGALSLGRSAAARAQRQRCTLALELLEHAGWNGPQQLNPLEFAAQLLSPAAPSDAHIVQLTMLVRNHAQRDALWLALAFEEDATEAAPEALFGGGLLTPRPERLELLCERLDRVRQRVPPEAEPVVLCFWAWALWASGQASMAMRALNRAERLASGEAIIEQLRNLVLGGRVPEWLLNGTGSVAPQQRQSRTDSA